MVINSKKWGLRNPIQYFHKVSWGVFLFIQNYSFKLPQYPLQYFKISVAAIYLRGLSVSCS